MDYILNTSAGMRIDFPPNKFGYNDLESKMAKSRTPDIDPEMLRGMIKPFPHLKFQRGQAIVTEERTLENPWTIDMIRQTQAYKEGKIWELSSEQIDQIRMQEPHPSMIIPPDFKKNKHEYTKGIDFLKIPFRPSKDAAKCKAECDEYLLTLQKVRKIYRIVNITNVKEQEDLKRYARSLEACRTQIEILLEDNGL
jgi:hypothetical protein